MQQQQKQQQPDQADIATRFPGGEDERSYRSVKRLRVDMGSEVERYFPIEAASNVLAWWKHRSDEYLCVAPAHRTGLPCHARNQCPDRPRECSLVEPIWSPTSEDRWLGEDTIQACMCLQSWLWLSFALRG